MGQGGEERAGSQLYAVGVSSRPCSEHPSQGRARQRLAVPRSPARCRDACRSVPSRHEIQQRAINLM